MKDIAQAFFNDIVENPFDDGPRLIFANWLEEHGESDRAEFIRLQCRRAAAEGEAGDIRRLLTQYRVGSIYSDEAARLMRNMLAAVESDGAPSEPADALRERELLRAHGKRWRRGCPGRIRFHRGFPEWLQIGVHEYLHAVDALARSAPLHRLDVTGFLPPTEEDEELGWLEEEQAQLDLVEQLANCPLLERCVEVDVSGCGCDILEALLASPHLRNLRRVIAVCAEAGDGVGAVVQPHLKELRWIDVYDTDSCSEEAGDESFESIVAARQMAHLEYLNFGASSVSDEGVRTLARSKVMNRLRSLGLAGNLLSPAALEAVAHSRRLSHLQHLDIGSNRAEPIGDDALAMLIASPLFEQLTFLDIHGNAVTDAGVAQLAASPRSAGLRALVIGGHQHDWVRGARIAEPQLLSTDAVGVLARSPHLPNLRRLELPKTPLDDAAALALANSPELPSLRALIVEGGPGLTRKGQRALAKRWGGGLALTPAKP